MYLIVPTPPLNDVQNGGFSFRSIMTKILKPAKKFNEQVELLESRKLSVDSYDSAKKFLMNNNYYRVSAYFKPYYNVKVGEEFKSSITMEHIKNLYMFDSDLRKLMIPILEKVEVAFRTHLAYYFAHEKGGLGYRNNSNFHNQNYYKKMIENIDKDIDRSKEKFIKFYKQNYNAKYPIWVLIEALSFGMISKFYGNMKNTDKAKLSRDFYNGLDRTFLENWIQTLVVTRNICAHHGRLFNREIMMPKLLKNMQSKINKGYEKRIFSVLLICKELIDNKSMWNDFTKDLIYIVEKYDFNHFQAMGFPENWQEYLTS